MMPVVWSSGVYTGSLDSTWDLRLGSHLQLTGGPYAGDIGRVIAKNDEGHYCLEFTTSMNTTFNVRRRPFQLWLGNWWIDMATNGYGITGQYD